MMAASRARGVAALLLQVCLLLSSNSKAQDCNGIQYAPNGTYPLTNVSTFAGSAEMIYTQPIYILHSTIAWQLSVYPTADNQGVLTIAGAVCAESEEGNGTLSVVAQSFTYTVSSFDGFTPTHPPIPLQLRFPDPPVLLTAGRYVIAIWYEWSETNATASQLSQWSFDGLPPMTAVFINSTNTTFGANNGVLPSIIVTGGDVQRTVVTPGILVGVTGVCVPLPESS
jgi:hypothetical protein